MSYEADQISSLRTAIRQEIPKLSREIRNAANSFEQSEVLATLEMSVKEQKITNLLMMCDISMKNPDLNLLTSGETREILTAVKEEMLGQKSNRKKKMR